MVKFWDFVGKQLARLRFGVTYIQMIYYASVILGALVLVTDRIFGEGTIGWIDSLLIIGGIFILEWLLGYYTERMGVIKKDVLQTMKQNIPGGRMVQQEIWSTVQIPLLEEMAERVLKKTLDKYKDEIIEVLKQNQKESRSK
ncbi:MAG: hypothetical protein KAU62_10425 [Candidatus Heimdallarchaeota archaeon]|nr:hypothetical protein [Candidatus Heimdallarchaeota archaeon]MCK4611559.1 hypothetical protein [Candidatus Heimdallarchaeota archaeon]